MYGSLRRRFSLISSLPLLLIVKCIVHVVAKLVQLSEIFVVKYIFAILRFMWFKTYSFSFKWLNTGRIYYGFFLW